MGQRDGKRGSRRAGGIIAGIVLLAFVIYAFHVAFEIASKANAELMFHGLFQQAVPLAVIVAGGLFAVLVFGVYWLHREPLHDCFRVSLRAANLDT